MKMNKPIPQIILLLLILVIQISFIGWDFYINIFYSLDAVSFIALLSIIFLLLLSLFNLLFKKEVKGINKLFKLLGYILIGVLVLEIKFIISFVSIFEYDSLSEKLLIYLNNTWRIILSIVLVIVLLKQSIGRKSFKNK